MSLRQNIRRALLLPPIGHWPELLLAPRQGCRKATKYKGIVADAYRLDVHRVYLCGVLSGRIKSPGLLQRYQQLKADQLAESNRKKLRVADLKSLLTSAATQ